jgi:hypothetical protein
VGVATSLGELLEVSEDIRAAVVFDPEDASVSASTLEDDGAAEFAESASAMLRAASGMRTDKEATRLEVAVSGGRVFVARSGRRAAAALTDADALSQLVFHDLRRTLDA